MRPLTVVHCRASMDAMESGLPDDRRQYGSTAVKWTRRSLGSFGSAILEGIAIMAKKAESAVAPTVGADHFKMAIVAGVLEAYPDGVSAAEVVDESGLRAAITARVLIAMEIAGVAVRNGPVGPDSVELWTRGSGDLAAVRLGEIPAYAECPTCGHRSRIRTTVDLRRSATGTAGRNGDGQPKLRRGELREMVIDFVNTHPGCDFSAGDIARELGRSPGAVQNNLEYLITEGLIRHAEDGDPNTRKVTMLDTDE